MLKVAGIEPAIRYVPRYLYIKKCPQSMPNEKPTKVVPNMVFKTDGKVREDITKTLNTIKLSTLTRSFLDANFYTLEIKKSQVAIIEK